MDPSVGRQELGPSRREWSATEVGDCSAGLFEDDRAGRDVPRLEVLLPEAVHATGRHITEVEGRGPEASNGSRFADEIAEQADDFRDALVNVVREPGHEH